MNHLSNADRSAAHNQTNHALNLIALAVSAVALMVSPFWAFFPLTVVVPLGALVLSVTAVRRTGPTEKHRRLAIAALMLSLASIGVGAAWYLLLVNNPIVFD